MHAGGAQRVARQALGGADGRRLVAEDFAHALHFHDVADGRRGAVGVQVVDGRVDGGQRLLHAAHRAFAAGRDHVVAVGGGAVADDLGVDFCAACQCVVERLDHHHAAAAGDDEAVALGVVGTRGLFRRVVVLGGQRAHGVEQERLAPVLFFTAAGEDDVLLAHLDLLHGVADAVRAGGAGRGDGVVQALDLEGRGQAGGHGAAHGPRHAVGADALDALFAQQVERFHLVQRGGAARAGDEAGARVGHLLLGQAGIGNGVLHGQVGIGRRVADKAVELAVDEVFEGEVDGAGHLAAQAHFGVGRLEPDAGAAGAQVGGDGLLVVAQARNDAQTGDDDASHGKTLRSCRWK
ncbi:hypothetical protein D9M68_528410 [compost metagenome]